MKKNEVLTIEEKIINEVEMATTKNILVDLLNEFLIESLEWLQPQPQDLKSYDKKVFIHNTVSEIYFRTEYIILDFDFLSELNYNYNLLEKLNIYDFNFYTVNLESKHINNINNVINEVISLKVIDYLKDIKDILPKIIDLYYFTIATEPTMAIPKILTGCEISEKNIEIIISYIHNNHNYYGDELERLFINSGLGGMYLDIDTNENIPRNIEKVLDLFQVK